MPSDIIAGVATRKILRTFVFKGDPSARKKIREKAKHFKNRLRTVKRVRDLEAVVDNIVSGGLQAELKDDIRNAIDRVDGEVRKKFSGAELRERLERLDALRDGIERME